MKRLFSLILLSGMFIAPTLLYSNPDDKDTATDTTSSVLNQNQYKDFAVGTATGAFDTLTKVIIFNLVWNILDSVGTLNSKISYVWKKPTVGNYVDEVLSRSLLVPTTSSALGLATFYLLDLPHLNKKSRATKFGFLTGSLATIAGIVGWHLYTLLHQ